MKKRGALELSINTIVIVVIGITLLTLALFFIRGIFGQLNTLTDDVFGSAEGQLRRLGQEDARLITPTRITIKQGETKSQEIIVGHDGTAGDSTLSFGIEVRRDRPTGVVDIKPSEQDVRARMIIPDTVSKEGSSCHTFDLNIGESLIIPLVVAATSNSPLTTGLDTVVYRVHVRTSKGVNSPGCIIDTGKLNNGGSEYENGLFIVNVEKGGGLFG